MISLESVDFFSKTSKFGLKSTASIKLFEGVYSGDTAFLRDPEGSVEEQKHAQRVL